MAQQKFIGSGRRFLRPPVCLPAHASKFGAKRRVSSKLSREIADDRPSNLSRTDIHCAAVF
ncbi:hypothetical protein PDR5_05970 [Pseudomonas sp. DR 5-09]|nr:hypothetical protein PDR5_05970 [Pseudomonas sp. DR 5-09]